jgi:sugar lactone lactonase YvrE
MNYKVITNPEKLKLSVSKKTLLCLSFIVYSLSFIHAQTITTFAGNGTGGFFGDGGQATAAELYQPAGVFPDASGNVYIADELNYRIRVVNSAGIISTIAGNGTQGFSGDGGPATAAEFHYPNDVSLDGSGNIYVNDYSNDRIRMINTNGIISTAAGNGINGYSGDGGPATAAELGSGWGACCDGSGNIFIPDASNNRIRKVNTAGIITTIAGTGTAGFSGDGGPATAAQISGPNGVYPDGAGNVYIADYGGNRIRMVNTAGIISTVAGNGTAGYSGDGGQGTAAEINAPTGVCSDGAGNVYIAEYGGNRIRMVSAGGIISTLAGNGAAGYSGDNGPATAAQVNVPARVHITPSGILYVADWNNHRIRKISGGPLSVSSITNMDCLIYPNPASDNLTVQLSKTGKTIVTLYDITGREVLNTVKENAPSFNISVTGMPAGIYLLKLQTVDGSMITKKIEVAR